MLRLAVFASGGGSNLQALIDHFNGTDSQVARVCLVISDRPDAGALARAERAGITRCVIAVTARSIEEVADEMLAVLAREQIDLIALAGYLKLVPEAVVRTFRDRIVNIHPALLPAFGGRGMYGVRVHMAVLESGCYVTGVTVHFVDERYDAGKPLLQWPVPVLRGDTAETLAARVLRVEHVAYPAAIEALARFMQSVHGAGFAAGDSACFTLEEGDVREALEAAMRKALIQASEGS